MNIQMTIFDSHVLVETDLVESLGQVVRMGNNTTLSLELDSSDLVDRIYAGLVFEGTEFQAPAPTPWAAYWGSNSIASGFAGCSPTQLRQWARSPSS